MHTNVLFDPREFEHLTHLPFGDIGESFFYLPNILILSCPFYNEYVINQTSSTNAIASERGFVFFLLSAAFIIFLLAAALVAEAPLTPFRRLGGMMFTVQIN